MNSKKGIIRQLIEQRYAYLFIGPAMIIFIIFVVIPIFASLFLSFTKYNVMQPPQLVGLSNYTNLIFRDPRFWKSLKNTAFYALGVVPPGIALSLFLAVIIDQKIKLKNVYKTIFFLPTVTPIVASAVIWKWLYAGEKYGLINNFIMKFGFEPVDWLMSPTWTLPAIMIMSIWAGMGYNMVIFLAGLQTIPHTMYEAAELDGANSWSKFWHITLPLLRPTMVFVVIMSTIVSFQVFDQVYIMTQGTGGGVGGVLDSGLTIVAYLYENGFEKFKMGYASSVAYLLFAIIFIMTLINAKLVKSKVDY